MPYKLTSCVTDSLQQPSCATGYRITRPALTLAPWADEGMNRHCYSKIKILLDFQVKKPQEMTNSQAGIS